MKTIIALIAAAVIACAGCDMPQGSHDREPRSSSSDDWGMGISVTGKPVFGPSGGIGISPFDGSIGFIP